MPTPEYQALYDCFPALIREMPEKFTSHAFILRLAQENQVAYIEALYQSRIDSNPFQTVHRALSQRLLQHSDAVRHLGETTSEDIFGRSNHCAQWQRLA